MKLAIDFSSLRAKVWLFVLDVVISVGGCLYYDWDFWWVVCGAASILIGAGQIAYMMYKSRTEVPVV